MRTFLIFQDLLIIQRLGQTRSLGSVGPGASSLLVKTLFYLPQTRGKPVKAENNSWKVNKYDFINCFMQVSLSCQVTQTN